MNVDHSSAESLTHSIKPLRFSQRLKRLAPYFGHLRGTWALVAISAVVAAVTEPLIPALLKPLLDRGFQQGALAIWNVPIALMLLFGVRGLASYLSQVGLTKITNHSLLIMRQAMFRKILTAEMALFLNQSSSALSNTVVYESHTGAGMLVGSILSLIRNALTLLALTGYLFYLNWQLTLIVTIVFPSVALIMRVLTRRVHKLTKTAQVATDELAYVVEENVMAHRDIRLYAAQTQQSERFNKLSTSLQRLAMKSTVAGAAMTPMTQMLAASALSAVISIALLQSAGSGTSVGSFVAFVTGMLLILAPIRQLSEVSSPITRGLAALERCLDLIEGVPDQKEGAFYKPRASGGIEFRAATVTYATDASPALNGVNLHIQPGETVALVGASGSGKSTLVNSLLRFVDISSGQILLDEHEVRDWSLACLREQFAFVSQHVVMLNDTIAANVALSVHIDTNKVLECLRAAHLSDWIKQLPHGINTVVGHNAMQLSGGQRQRLSIARALYKKAPVLILDEATSALDTASERVVQDALQSLMDGTTTIVIAHRLSTVMHADRIVVMEAGKIIESGTHLQMLTAQGHYARLYKMGLGRDLDL
jgi:ATP-binding cassette, subfamily B, bacterial MsbA